MRAPDNDLEAWFQSHDGKLIQKWEHYFSAYEKHFSRFRGKGVTILEIGISQGGSIEMWKHYFGAAARIYGIDIDPHCQMFAEPGVEIFVGSQQDPQFLREVAAKIPPVDILIDDGGHTMRQQITTFEVLFDKVKDGGVYLCEDTHTSYRLDYGGGYRRRGTFMERAKSLVDSINAYHSELGASGPTSIPRLSARCISTTPWCSSRRRSTAAPSSIGVVIRVSRFLRPSEDSWSRSAIGCGALRRS